MVLTSLPPELPGLIAEGLRIQRGRRAAFEMLVNQRPQAPAETALALHAGLRPFERLIRRRGKHHGRTHCIGAVFVEQVLWISGIT